MTQRNIFNNGGANEGGAPLARSNASNSSNALFREHNNNNASSSILEGLVNSSNAFVVDQPHGTANNNNNSLAGGFAPMGVLKGDASTNPHHTSANNSSQVFGFSEVPISAYAAHFKLPSSITIASLERIMKGVEVSAQLALKAADRLVLAVLDQQHSLITVQKGQEVAEQKAHQERQRALILMLSPPNSNGNANSSSGKKGGGGGDGTAIAETSLSAMSESTAAAASPKCDVTRGASGTGGDDDAPLGTSSHSGLTNNNNNTEEKDSVASALRRKKEVVVEATEDLLTAITALSNLVKEARSSLFYYNPFIHGRSARLLYLLIDLAVMSFGPLMAPESSLGGGGSDGGGLMESDASSSPTGASPSSAAFFARHTPPTDTNTAVAAAAASTQNNSTHPHHPQHPPSLLHQQQEERARTVLADAQWAFDISNHANGSAVSYVISKLIAMLEEVKTSVIVYDERAAEADADGASSMVAAEDDDEDDDDDDEEVASVSSPSSASSSCSSDEENITEEECSPTLANNTIARENENSDNDDDANGEEEEEVIIAIENTATTSANATTTTTTATMLMPPTANTLGCAFGVSAGTTTSSGGDSTMLPESPRHKRKHTCEEEVLMDGSTPIAVAGTSNTSTSWPTGDDQQQQTPPEALAVEGNGIAEAADAELTTSDNVSEKKKKEKTSKKKRSLNEEKSARRQKKQQQQPLKSPSQSPFVSSYDPLPSLATLHGLVLLITRLNELMIKEEEHVKHSVMGAMYAAYHVDRGTVLRMRAEEQMRQRLQMAGGRGGDGGGGSDELETEGDQSSSQSVSTATAPAAVNSSSSPSPGGNFSLSSPPLAPTRVRSTIVRGTAASMSGSNTSIVSGGGGNGNIGASAVSQPPARSLSAVIKRSSPLPPSSARNDDGSPQHYDAEEDSTQPSLATRMYARRPEGLSPSTSPSASPSRQRAATVASVRGRGRPAVGGGGGRGNDASSSSKPLGHAALVPDVFLPLAEIAAPNCRKLSFRGVLEDRLRYLYLQLSTLPPFEILSAAGGLTTVMIRGGGGNNNDNASFRSTATSGAFGASSPTNTTANSSPINPSNMSFGGAPPQVPNHSFVDGGGGEGGGGGAPSYPAVGGNTDNASYFHIFGNSATGVLEGGGTAMIDFQALWTRAMSRWGLHGFMGRGVINYFGWWTRQATGVLRNARSASDKTRQAMLERRQRRVEQRKALRRNITRRLKERAALTPAALSASPDGCDDAAADDCFVAIGDVITSLETADSTTPPSSTVTPLLPSVFSTAIIPDAPIPAVQCETLEAFQAFVSALDLTILDRVIVNKCAVIQDLIHYLGIKGLTDTRLQLDKMVDNAQREMQLFTNLAAIQRIVYPATAYALARSHRVNEAESWVQMLPREVCPPVGRVIKEYCRILRCAQTPADVHQVLRRIDRYANSITSAAAKTKNSDPFSVTSSSCDSASASCPSSSTSMVGVLLLVERVVEHFLSVGTSSAIAMRRTATSGALGGAGQPSNSAPSSRGGPSHFHHASLHPQDVSFDTQRDALIDVADGLVRELTEGKVLTLSDLVAHGIDGPSDSAAEEEKENNKKKAPVKDSSSSSSTDSDGGDADLDAIGFTRITVGDQVATPPPQPQGGGGEEVPKKTEATAATTEALPSSPASPTRKGFTVTDTTRRGHGVSSPNATATNINAPASPQPPITATADTMGLTSSSRVASRRHLLASLSPLFGRHALHVIVVYVERFATRTAHWQALEHDSRIRQFQQRALAAKQARQQHANGGRATAPGSQPAAKSPASSPSPKVGLFSGFVKFLFGDDDEEKKKKEQQQQQQQRQAQTSRNFNTAGTSGTFNSANNPSSSSSEGLKMHSTFHLNGTSAGDSQERMAQKLSLAPSVLLYNFKYMTEGGAVESLCQSHLGSPLMPLNNSNAVDGFPRPVFSPIASPTSASPLPQHQQQGNDQSMLMSQSTMNFDLNMPEGLSKHEEAIRVWSMNRAREVERRLLTPLHVSKIKWEMLPEVVEMAEQWAGGRLSTASSSAAASQHQHNRFSATAPANTSSDRPLTNDDTTDNTTTDARTDPAQITIASPTGSVSSLGVSIHTVALPTEGNKRREAQLVADGNGKEKGAGHHSSRGLGGHMSATAAAAAGLSHTTNSNNNKALISADDDMIDAIPQQCTRNCCLDTITPLWVYMHQQAYKLGVTAPTDASAQHHHGIHPKANSYHCPADQSKGGGGLLTVSSAPALPTHSPARLPNVQCTTGLVTVQDSKHNDKRHGPQSHLHVHNHNSAAALCMSSMLVTKEGEPFARCGEGLMPRLWAVRCMDPSTPQLIVDAAAEAAETAMPTVSETIDVDTIMRAAGEKDAAQEASTTLRPSYMGGGGGESSDPNAMDTATTEAFLENNVGQGHPSTPETATFLVCAAAHLANASCCHHLTVEGHGLASDILKSTHTALNILDTTLWSLCDVVLGDNAALHLKRALRGVAHYEGDSGVGAGVGGGGNVMSSGNFATASNASVASTIAVGGGGGAPAATENGGDDAAPSIGGFDMYKSFVPSVELVEGAEEGGLYLGSSHNHSSQNNSTGIGKHSGGTAYAPSLLSSGLTDKVHSTAVQKQILIQKIANTAFIFKSPDSILPPNFRRAIHRRLPPFYQLQDWRNLYSTNHHGISLSRLLSCAAEEPASIIVLHVRPTPPPLSYTQQLELKKKQQLRQQNRAKGIIDSDEDDEEEEERKRREDTSFYIGAFLAAPLKMNSKAYHGSGETFVFRFPSANDCASSSTSAAAKAAARRKLLKQQQQQEGCGAGGGGISVGGAVCATVASAKMLKLLKKSSKQQAARSGGGGGGGGGGTVAAAHIASASMVAQQHNAVLAQQSLPRHFEFWPWAHTNEYFVNCKQGEMLAIGGPAPAIYIDESLSRGATSFCRTFASPALTSPPLCRQQQNAAAAAAGGGSNNTLSGEEELTKDLDIIAVDLYGFGQHSAARGFY